VRVWEGDREGAERRKAMKQLRFLEERLRELGEEVEVRVWVLCLKWVWVFVVMDAMGGWMDD
jgi:hypothetical protein